MDEEQTKLNTYNTLVMRIPADVAFLKALKSEQRRAKKVMNKSLFQILKYKFKQLFNLK